MTLEIWRVVLGVWEEVIVVMFYGTAAWDPWLIVAQILCLQCLYYLSLGVFLTFLVGTRVSRMSLVYFFDYAAVTTSTVTGWCVIASFLLSSLAGWEFHFTFFFLICNFISYIVWFWCMWLRCESKFIFVLSTTFLNYEKLEIFVEFYDLSPAFYCPTQVCVSFNSWYDTDTMMLLLNLY